MYSVSIVIPCYKGLDYIKDAVASLACSEPFEIIIVVDDDTPLSVFSKRLENFKNIVLLSNSKNMGVTFSRNKGFLHCKGEVVIFLDADDVLITAIDNILKEVRDNPAQIYFFRCIDDNDQVVGKASQQEGQRVTLTDEMVAMNNKGERLVVVKKISHSKPPFLGQTRGHEMAGLIRFLNFQNKYALYYSNLRARRYQYLNESSLSLTRSNYSKPLSIGHFIVFRYLVKRFKPSALLWFAKSVYRRCRL